MKWTYQPTVLNQQLGTFTIGRGNWMFFNSENGAQNGADMYSLIVTAKESEMKPYDYLE